MSYPQSKVVNQIGGEGGYCCVVAPPSHHGSCHPPSCASLSGPAWSSQYWPSLDRWSDNTQVPAWTHIVNTKCILHTPSPPYLHSIMPTGYTKHVHTHPYMHSHAYSKCTAVPKLNSIYINIAYRSCCTDCIIYIHKLNFILIVNYTLCFKEMHCVNRINCCDWNWRCHIWLNAHVKKKMHTPPNWAHMNILFVFTICDHCGVSRVCKRGSKIWMTSTGIFHAKSWSLSLYSIKTQTRVYLIYGNLCDDTALWCSRAVITPSTLWSR